MTLINDARLALGKGPIGESQLYRVAARSSSCLQGLSILWYIILFSLSIVFVIPLQLYHPPFSGAFQDITTGKNPGCGESLWTIRLLAIASNYGTALCRDQRLPCVSRTIIFFALVQV
jgi:hypothetical protein